MDQGSPSSGSEEEEDIEADEDDDESEDTSDMDEVVLVPEKPTLPRPRNHALVEDSGGEIQYKHT